MTPLLSQRLSVEQARHCFSLRRYSAALRRSPSSSVAFRRRSRNAATRQRPEQNLAVITCARYSLPQRSHFVMCRPWRLPRAAIDRKLEFMP